MTTIEQLSTRLDELASFDSGPYPVISLYLALQPGEQGRDQFQAFVRNTLAERIATYAAQGPERESLDKDADAIRDYLQNVDPASNGLALFTSSGAGLFEAFQLATPVAEHVGGTSQINRKSTPWRTSSIRSVPRGGGGRHSDRASARDRGQPDRAYRSGGRAEDQAAQGRRMVRK